MSLLSIIIPAYNEEATISDILDKVRAVELPEGVEREIVIVNDYSTDATAQVVRDYITSHAESTIAFYEHEVNKGKGAALHTGIASAKGDYIIIQDADLE